MSNPLGWVGRQFGRKKQINKPMKKAVILLSGGLDSTTVLAIAKNQDFECHAISFDYGQRHKVELKNAANVAKEFGVKSHKVAKIDLRIFGGSALTDEIEVPKDAQESDEIPITYVPARNTIFLSYALAFAETIDAFDILIGANAVDYSGYPDCRPEFIKAYEEMANLATSACVSGEKKLKIHAPLIDLTKKAIIEAGTGRLRAIILTSATTYFGLVPLLSETSPQSQFLIPAATSMGYGILFATAITLILVPALVMIQEDAKQIGSKLMIYLFNNGQEAQQHEI